MSKSEQLMAAKIFAAAVVTQTNVAGMIAENMQRAALGKSMAYASDAFCCEAGELENTIGEILRGLR